VFHSFRHTLANSLKQKGVQEVIIAEILGHAVDSMTMSRYGKRYEPKVLLEAISKYDFKDEPAQTIEVNLHESSALETS
jgi:integrase